MQTGIRKLTLRRFRVLGRGKIRFLDVDQAPDAEDTLRDSCFLKITHALGCSPRCCAEIHRQVAEYSARQRKTSKDGRREGLGARRFVSPLTVHTVHATSSSSASYLSRNLVAVQSGVIVVQLAQCVLSSSGIRISWFSLQENSFYSSSRSSGSARGARGRRRFFAGSRSSRCICRPASTRLLKEHRGGSTLRVARPKT